MKRILAVLLLLLPGIVTSPLASGASGQPIRIIVATPPGGGSDLAARTVAEALSRTLNEPVIVDNKAGANGTIALQSLLDASGDGHTLLWGIASMGTIPLLQKSAPLRSLAELTPVSTVGTLTFGIFVSPRVPSRSLEEFIAYARANPGTLNYATGTLGEYIAGVGFLKVTGIDAVRVPYRGGSQLMPDLIGDRVQFNLGPLAAGLPYVSDGTLHLVGVLGATRSPAAPTVPALAEYGIRLADVPTWQAIFAPPHTPQQLIGRLTAAIGSVLSDPVVRNKLEQQGLRVGASTPARLAKIAADDVTVWRRFITDNDIPQE